MAESDICDTAESYVQRVQYMKKNKASFTAKGIATLRAVESAKPENQRLFYDPYAKLFAGRMLFWLSKLVMDTGYAGKRGPGVPEFIAARVRYIDDYLLACVKEDLQQLVILGAGYDSRAYRFAGILSGVKVFEVDHPASLKDKREKLNKYDVDYRHVVYVPVDFNTDSLGERLEQHGYSAQNKTLFIWEGVTYYLESQAVDATLSFIAGNSGKGSSVIFDYTYTWVISGDCRRGEIIRMKRYRRLTNEGFIFGIEEGKISEFLKARGFSEVVNAGSEDFKRMYYGDSNKEVAPVYSIVHAKVNKS